MAIKAHRLFHLIDYEPPPESVLNFDGVPIQNLEYLDWEILDKQLLSCIFASVTEGALPYILQFQTSKEA